MKTQVLISIEANDKEEVLSLLREKGIGELDEDILCIGIAGENDLLEAIELTPQRVKFINAIHTLSEYFNLSDHDIHVELDENDREIRY